MEKLEKKGINKIEESLKIDDRRPTSYTLSKINKRKAIEAAKKVDAKIIILESIEYYRQEYPNSTRNITWSKPKNNFKMDEIDDVDEFLSKCTEKQLYEIRESLIYSQKEAIRKVKDRDRYDLVITRVKKRIPGIKYIERLEAIQKKENEILREKARYEKIIREEREEFNMKRSETVKPIETVKTDSNREPYFCTDCGHTHVKGNIYIEHYQFKRD